MTVVVAMKISWSFAVNYCLYCCDDYFEIEVLDWPVVSDQHYHCRYCTV